VKLITQPPPSVDITNERSYNSSPPYAFLGCTETKLPLHSSVLVSHPKRILVLIFQISDRPTSGAHSCYGLSYAVYTRCSKLFSHASWFYFGKSSRKGFVETYFQLAKNCCNLLNSNFRFFSSLLFRYIPNRV